MKWLRCFLALCVLCVGQLVVADGGYAASDYDGVIKNGGDLTLKLSAFPEAGGICGPKSHTADLGTTWASIVTDPSKWYGNQWYPDPTQASEVNTAITAFHSAVDSGKGWAVVQNTAWQDYTNPDGSSVSYKAGDKWLTVLYSDTPTATFRDDGPNGPRLSMAGNWYALTISYMGYPYPRSQDSCVLGVTYARHEGPTYDFPIQAANNPNIKSVFTNFDINYDSVTGYAGQHTERSWTPPPASYVAMGDSFSSGEGALAFEAGTDTDGVNECHRSSSAYPRILQQDAALNLIRTSFVACSGATTYTVRYGGEGGGSWGRPPQIAALSRDIDQVVTITIGGNDVGFKEYATACVVSSCNFGSQAYSDIVHKILIELPSKLQGVYADIDAATSENAKIYVVGYPQIAPSPMPTNLDCWPLNGGPNDETNPANNDGAAAHAVVSTLNQEINNAMSNYGSSKFTFVDPNTSNSPFIGHDWCQQDPYRYFQIIAWNGLEYSFHPTSYGHQAYASVIKGAMQ